MSKEIVRKKLLDYRKHNFRSASLDYSLLKVILRKYGLVNKKKIGGYFPINYEIDCFEILKKLEKAGNKISLPITKKKNQMDFFEWSFDKPLSVGTIGVPEPQNTKKTYPDIILVPLVAFDKNKFRLGYGGGYYDRYIHRINKLKKVLTVGLAFSFQEVQKIPVNNFDKKLDYILTENYLI